MTPKKFRATETIPYLQTAGDVIEAVQIEETEIDAILEWCGGERAVNPLFAIAIKGWTCTWNLSAVGDWIICRDDQFRGKTNAEMERYWEPL